MRSSLCAGGIISLVILVSCLERVHGYYLPGVKMITYKKGDVIPMYVNSLTSAETLLPVDYYKLPFCKPVKIEKESENLGEYLTANRIQSSPYKINFLESVECQIVCSNLYNKKHIKRFDNMIKDDYRVHWILDNLPVSMDRMDGIHELGFPLGRYNAELDKHSQLNNHVRIRIGYHVPQEASGPEEGRVVDFAVFPYSFDYKDAPDTGRSSVCTHSDSMPEPLYMYRSQSNDVKITWTYSVEWVEMKDREWRTRWDVYFELGSGSDDVHWFSIINALLIVLFLSGMVGMILMRSLHRDISRYNRVPTEEERAEEREESGWKLVHADVFRPPTNFPMLFCVMVGSGVQLFDMAIATLVFASIGFLSPSNRGNLMVALLVTFVLMGIFAGYASSRNYKMFKGKRWQLCTTLTATMFPGAIFGIFFLLNLFAWGAGSDAAVPFGSMLVVIILWFCISVPLVFVGAWAGFRKETTAFPVATSNIPRPIPEQPWYMSTGMTALVGGILPFGAIFVELYFVLTSLWTDKYYYVFGFLFLACFILVSTCAEITMVLCYFQLCGEDYNWWWRSFLVSGACGGYVFLYSFYYYLTRLDVNNFIGTMLYFGYMAAMSVCIFLITGMTGYYASLWFTRKIYASIKVD